MAKFHDTIQMHPTKCQMQIINRYFPLVSVKDCAIRYEGGSHFTDGRDYDGTFCVHIYRKGRYIYQNKKFKKQ